MIFRRQDRLRHNYLPVCHLINPQLKGEEVIHELRLKPRHGNSSVLFNESTIVFRIVVYFTEG
jgi:hypothetical protein